jgi:hypothetical protein
MVRRPPPNPLFYGKNSEKRVFQAPYRSNLTLQVVDFIFIQQEFPYAGEQRNLAAEQGN